MVDQPYVLQALGKTIIRHEQSLLSTVRALGEKNPISYRRGR
ncbi:KfrB domain-containing protein [Methylomonas sp. MS20]